MASAQVPASSSQGPLRLGKGLMIPRLALGGLQSAQGGNVVLEKAPAPMATDEFSEAPSSGDSKRFKGPELSHMPSTARGAPSTASTAASAIYAVPQTARPGIAPLQLQHPPSGDSPVRAQMKLGGMPALNLGAMSTLRQPASRAKSDAPVMLNLEEIQMSEEDLVNSYDPNNEENNYHLPNHLYKQLKLNHFRKELSEVIPGKLFISSFQVAADLERLKEERITHIVNTAGDICESRFPDHFKYTTYYLKDANSEDISLLFYKTLEWIDTAVEAEGRVLVHCREGVSRSATMIIAYLMWKFDLSFDAAHERIRKVRPICNPNTGFTCQLLLLGKRLNAGKLSPEEAPPSTPSLLRIAPYHPKEPFLIAAPTEMAASGPILDPRFGYVIQQGSSLVLWMGSKIPERKPVSAAVAQYAKWLEMFEHNICSVQVVEEGSESADLWQALGRGAPEDPPEPLVAPKAAFDGDFSLLCGGGEWGPPTGV